VTNGDARRAEREAAYAKNPDQPIVRSTFDRGEAAMLAQHRAHMHAARHAKPVPMLLQKRRPAPPPAEVTGTAPQAREPETV
jgi:hypothetical protein